MISVTGNWRNTHIRALVVGIQPYRLSGKSEIGLGIDGEEDPKHGGGDQAESGEPGEGQM